MSIEIPYIFQGMMVFMRVGAFFLSIPVFAGQSIPAFVRAALALLTAIILAPLVVSHSVYPSHFSGFFLAAGMELLVGALMGMAMHVFLAILEFVGETIGMEIGLVRSATINPMDDSGSSSMMGGMLFYLGLIIFFAVGAHYQVIYALVRSFEVIPAGGFGGGNFSFEPLLTSSGKIFAYGLLMSAPFIAVNLLINMTFAILGKVAPKMNVFMVSFAVRILAGLMVLASTIGLIAHYCVRLIQEIPVEILKFIQ
jgi:flagellar biosynthetic protein FliR